MHREVAVRILPFEATIHARFTGRWMGLKPPTVRIPNRTLPQDDSKLWKKKSAHSPWQLEFALATVATVLGHCPRSRYPADQLCTTVGAGGRREMGSWFSLS